MKKRIVLAGGGHAHLAVLADWARQPLPDSQCLLVTSSRHTAYSGMLPGWMAGLYRGNDLLIDLQPLAERAGADLILADAVGLDTGKQVLKLSTGAEIGFDLLSLAIGGETDIARLAALGERLLPVRPVEAFMARWTEFLERSSSARKVHVAVVGGGAAGVELALGARMALCHLSGEARVSLITPAYGFLSGHGARVRKLAMAELTRRGIAVHFAQADGRDGALLLSSGEVLTADCVIAATGSRAPAWLAKSGLECNPAGFVAVDAAMRSISHPAIFAAGDIIDRVDRDLARSGVHAVKAGPVVAANLRATLAGTALRQYQPRRRTLYLLALGNRRAILSWGGLVAAGNWAWRIKNRIDRSFVSRYARTVQGWRSGGLWP